MTENKVILSTEKVQLIEELAQVNETLGHQPAMSKILALLTVSDETELTFDQIKETLGLSKSAVSQALTQLSMVKKISYKTRIGDRKRYFHVRMADWDTQILQQFQGIESLIAIYKKVLAERPATTKEFNESMADMTNFLSLIHNQVIATYQKYQEEHK